MATGNVGYAPRAEMSYPSARLQEPARCRVSGAAFHAEFVQLTEIPDHPFNACAGACVGWANLKSISTVRQVCEVPLQAEVLSRLAQVLLVARGGVS